MKTYPNQRILTECKYAACDQNHYYMKMNINALENAFSKLKNISSLKLFLYLSKNQENFKYAISSQDICSYCNMSKPSYLAAFKDLEEQNYLINLGNNKYRFVQYP